MHLNAADLVILLLILLSACVGLFRGFIREVLSLATWLAAVLLAMMLGQPVGEVLPLDPALNPWITRLAGGALVFFLVLISGGILTHFLAHVAKATGLSGTDRTLGAAFGLFRGAVVVLAILMFLPALVPVHESGWWQESSLIPGFLAFENRATELFGLMFQWISQLFSGSG